MAAQHWVFGYGSLIWKVDFPFHERRRAAIHGWARRFWQGSHDHRGTPDAPGRVVTLVPTTGHVTACIGVAYRVDEAVFAHLDVREKNGYERVDVDIHLPTTSASDGEQALVPGVTYLGREGNAAFLGPASLEDMAAQILRSKGPSGSNVDYLLTLHRALLGLCTVDRHVSELARRVSEQTASLRPQECFKSDGETAARVRAPMLDSGR